MMEPPPAALRRAARLRARGGIVHVADPYQDNPLDDGLHYAVGMDRLVGAILLGVITWDANLTIVEPAR
jgi:hypothetical protein